MVKSFEQEQAMNFFKVAKSSGGLKIMKYCGPPWLTDEENFSFQIF